MIPKSISDLPLHIPLFPLEGALLLPRGKLALNVFEPRYLQMTDEALASTKLIGIIQPVNSKNKFTSTDLYPVGCVGYIRYFVEEEGPRYLIELLGISRFRLQTEISSKKLYRIANVDFNEYEEDFSKEKSNKFDTKIIINSLKTYFSLNDITAEWDEISKTNIDYLASILTQIIPFSPSEKQAILEATTIDERINIMTTLLDMMAISKNSPKNSIN